MQIPSGRPQLCPTPAWRQRDSKEPPHLPGSAASSHPQGCSDTPWRWGPEPRGGPSRFGTLLREAAAKNPLAGGWPVRVAHLNGEELGEVRRALLAAGPALGTRRGQEGRGGCPRWAQGPTLWAAAPLTFRASWKMGTPGWYRQESEEGKAFGAFQEGRSCPCLPAAPPSCLLAGAGPARCGSRGPRPGEHRRAGARLPSALCSGSNLCPQPLL